MLAYEEKAVGKQRGEHEYLTKLVAEIRKDLSIKNKSFPGIDFNYENEYFELKCSKKRGK